jgi:hypothetical protein
MKIESSLDWHEVHSKLRSQIQQLGWYNPDLQRLLNNITNMVTELSKLEVTFRRIHKHSMLVETVSEINKAIDHLEKLILMAKLMK